MTTANRIASHVSRLRDMANEIHEVSRSQGTGSVEATQLEEVAHALLDVANEIESTMEGLVK